MRFVLPTPSLQHLTLVKVVSRLWNRGDICSQIAEINMSSAANGGIQIQWKAIEDKVKEKVSVLELPELCKELLLNLVQPLGMEILNWCTCHYDCAFDNNYDFSFFKNLLKHLCWTALGTVAYKPTAELIAKDETVEIMTRYKIACANCAEKELRQLFQRLSEEERKDTVNESAFFGRGNHSLMILWSCMVDGDMDQFLGHEEENFFAPYQIGLLFAIECGNRAACEYFFDQLGMDEVDAVFVERQPHLENNLIVLHFLLKMNDVDEQEILYSACPSLILKCLLCWPWQTLFMEMARCDRWGFLDAEHYIVVLNAISLKIRRGCKDYDYSGLFRDFWQIISVTAKNYYLNNCICLVEAVRTKDKKLIEMVIDEVSMPKLGWLRYSIRHGLLREIWDDESIDMRGDARKEWQRKLDLECYTASHNVIPGAS